jgi:hypothetical protein
MIINEFIMQNERLSVEMNIFAEEIDKLELLYNLFKRKPDQEYSINPNLSGILRQKLRRAKDHFSMLNKAYDLTTHKDSSKYTEAFISEANEGIYKIQETFRKIRYEST